MKDNMLTYIFGAIAALSGLVYLWQAHTDTGAQQPTTNVFPPLNTPDSAITGAETTEPFATSGTATSANSGTPSTLTPWPVYLV